MNNKYTFNKYSTFNPINPNSPDLRNFNDPYITKNTNSQLQIDVSKKYKCGNLSNLIETKPDPNINSSFLQPKTIEQYFFNHFCQYPIIPLDDQIGLEKWEKKQPIKYDNDNYVKFSENQYPINQLPSYKILNKYDNTNMFSHTFFTQLDGRLSNQN
jgi:hypothetical protein